MSYKVRLLPGWSLPGLPPLLLAGVLAVAEAALLLAAEPAQAESSSAKNRNQAAAEKLMAQGAAAITAKDFAAAQTLLTEAYHAYQSPKILYYLGTLRAAEQKTIEAQDLLRRFLADSTVELSEPLRQQAQKLLAGLPAADGGEVLLGAPRGAEVTVDGKVVGALPLPLPLLLSPGAHQITVQQGKWRAASEAKVKTARLLELRFKANSEVVVATEPPTILVADSYPDPALQDSLRQRLTESIRRENMAPLIGSAAILSARELATTPGCLADAACQRRLAEKFGSDYVLSAQMTRRPAEPKSLRIELQLFDLAVGEMAATRSSGCDGCTADAAASKLAEAVAALLSATSERGRGDLEITSEPADAEVLVDGKPIGKTPLKKVVFTGSYGLEVRKRGLHAQPQRITVGPSEPARVAFTLVPEGVIAPPPPPPTVVTPEGPRHRPLWRVATGAAALGVGALLVGFGASALAVDGQCVSKADNTDGRPPGGCLNPLDPKYYMTGVPGIGLTVSGAVLLVGGAILIALPPSADGQKANKSARQKVQTAEAIMPRDSTYSGVTQSSVAKAESQDLSGSGLTSSIAERHDF